MINPETILKIHKKGYISDEDRTNYAGIDFEWQKFDNKIVLTKIIDKWPPINHKVFICCPIKINHNLIEFHFCVRRFKYHDDGSKPYFCHPNEVYPLPKYIDSVNYRDRWAEIPNHILNNENFSEIIYINPLGEMTDNGRYYVVILHNTIIDGHHCPNDESAMQNLGFYESDNEPGRKRRKKYSELCPQGFKVKYSDVIKVINYEQ